PSDLKSIELISQEELNEIRRIWFYEKLEIEDMVPKICEQKAKGQYLIRVDSHCEIPPAYIETAIETITSTGAGNVGGIQKAVGKGPYQSAVAHAMTSRFGVGNSKFHYGGEEGPSDTVYLGVYEAELFHELGGFDESLVRNQDYELNTRIRRAGRVVWFDPKLAVTYSPRSNFVGLSSQYFQYGKWKKRVIAKDPRSTKFRQIVPPATVLILLASLVLSFVYNLFFLTIPFSYIFAILVASCIIPKITIQQRLLLVLVFPTMHLSWGIGFLIGTGN
ncbi:MAG: hypothetical protein QF388_07290, partial [Acidimicrobiales bacterium]|nr:hypothetical protein [Acidimicrobiales bacterium]